MFWDRNEKIMMANVKDSGAWLPTRVCSRKAELTPRRNEASLNCVSLRSELDCEVSCKAVKGQDERRHSAAPLTASPLTSRGLRNTTQNSQGFTGRQTKGGMLWIARVANRRS